MLKLSLLLILAASLSKTTLAKPPLYSLLPDCDVISVKDFGELTASHSHILGEPERCVLFRIEESDTFLVKKDPKWSSFDEPVEELAKTSPRSSSGANSGLTKKILGARAGTEWVEFRFTDFEQRTTEGLVPVSVCHSEIYGEGSLVSFQAIFGRSRSLSGSFGFQLQMANLMISLSTDVALETSVALSSKVQCEVKEGEVGQVLLQNTQYMYYTPFTRVLLYDAAKKELLWTEREFKEGARERNVIKGGLGEWVCASSANIDLKCHLLGYLGPFMGVARDELEQILDKGKEEDHEEV